MRRDQTTGYPGKRTPGRTRYTKELGRYICERIAEGEGLVAVARDGDSAAELSALPEAVGDVEVDAWLEGLIVQACDWVVGAINACPQNAPIASGLGKVPAECKRTAIVLARHAAISAVPAMHQALEGETRHDEYNSATADLAALAACDLLPMYELEEEESAIDEESAPGIGVMGKESPDWLI